MDARRKIFAGGVVILIIGTAIGSLAAVAQSQPAKPDPPRSSYMSVNEDDSGTVFARMPSAKAEVMKRQRDPLAARYDLSDRVAFPRAL
jgi:hypothetical protein